MIGQVDIVTERFLLRPLTEQDVTERYLGWLHDADAQKFITAAAQTKDLRDLNQYVRDRVGRDDVLFLGIFERATRVHIGNIKYEPVNSELSYAVMGVLIGDPAYRGRGATAEVLRASAKWLMRHRHITQLVLGVSESNRAAIRAYTKVGFAIAETPHIPRPLPGSITMVWRLSNIQT